MGDVESSVGGSLEGGEDLSTGGGSLQSNVENSVEGAGSVVHLLDVVVLSVDGLVTLVLVGQVELGQGTSGSQQTGSVGSGVVGQTSWGSVTGELVGVGSNVDDISDDLGRDDLADDVGVGETDDQTVARRVVLVLVLSDQGLSGLVVGLSGWRWRLE